jgi:hypothetical protein
MGGRGDISNASFQSIEAEFTAYCIKALGVIYDKESGLDI